MDNTEELTVLSLCTGYGGLDIGLARAIHLKTILRLGDKFDVPLRKYWTQEGKSWNKKSVPKLVHMKTGQSITSEYQTTGWTDCGCGAGFTGGIVLDPFMGSGTTGMVAYENRRNYIGIELNPEYIKMDRGKRAKEKYELFEKD